MSVTYLDQLSTETSPLSSDKLLGVRGTGVGSERLFSIGDLAEANLAQATIIATEIAAAAVAGHDGLAEAHGGNRSFAALKAKTAAGFVYVGVNPKRADADYVPQHNRRLDELPLWCVRNAVDFYDVSNAFNADPRGLANLLADPVHPNADGYTLYAQMLAAPIVT